MTPEMTLALGTAALAASSSNPELYFELVQHGLGCRTTKMFTSTDQTAFVQQTQHTAKLSCSSLLNTL